MKKNSSHVVIILPGAGDDALNGLSLATWWTKHDAKKFDTIFIKLPVGWKLHVTAETIEKRYQEIVSEVEKIAAKYESISFFSVSAATPIALLLSFKHLEKLKSVVSFCGYIHYDQKYFDRLPIENIAYITKKWVRTLENNPTLANEVGKRTLVVVPKKDEIIPLELQRWKLAAKEITINHYFHVSATMIDSVYHLARGENDPIWSWLVKGPSPSLKNS